MAPTKNVYVREADLELWNRAEKLAPQRSISALIAQLLRGWVENRERLVDHRGMGQITVSHHVDDEGTAVRKRFVGRLLLQEFVSQYPEGNWDAGFMNHNVWFAAVTPKGAFVVWTVDDLGNREWFAVYDSLDAMRQGDVVVPDDVVAAVAAITGEAYVQDLDI